MRLKIILMLFIALIIASCSFYQSGINDKQSKNSYLDSESPDRADSNLILDGDFECGTSTTITNWSFDAWDMSRSTFVWEPGGGINNSRCVSITSSPDNDARWVQSVQVVPGQFYRLSGMVKGENILGWPLGANLSIVNLNGANTGSVDSTGTFDWKNISMNFVAPASGTVTIGCRLGDYAISTSSGKAYFDNVSLIVEPDYNFFDGTKVNLYLEKIDSDSSVISDANKATWLTNLDNAYTWYVDLVGLAPYNGDEINVFSTRNYPGGWAVAGNPVLWYEPNIKDELTKVNNNNDWSFGILHEIGHDFDIEDRWNFNAEFLANFKMFYTVINLMAKVTPDGENYYTGPGLISYYYSKGSEGNYTWDYETYRFITLTASNQLGWEPFKKTFKYFLDQPLSSLPTTASGKFELFLDMLSEYSGKNVETIIPQAELDWLRSHI